MTKPNKPNESMAEDAAEKRRQNEARDEAKAEQAEQEAAEAQAAAAAPANNVFAGSPDARQQDNRPVTRFRPTYRALNDAELEVHNKIKELAEQLEELYSRGPGGRYHSLAITALEESVMWAVKGLTS